MIIEIISRGVSHILKPTGRESDKDVAATIAKYGGGRSGTQRKLDLVHPSSNSRRAL